ncbi:hypothetical protein DICPUDRAFT_91932 [Dictyostelium purpureum]|uniref:HMG box domain-containing protein n=1 Tax=Dictyostelium purpureum TaxID=5786 RepID=F0ZJE8_DICPU|nr:uncharacterized protein DICPUDRAFT_91932 [Dictyostelium purpureum]EGC35946.1 hypothetical protein DICPUDRAFT_91932 [Dictyostelium purpureum]|eukprot:XP_003287519.1 hypothetical protein DICPUDRAFT_91932 [Dictyostelium purpureum]
MKTKSSNKKNVTVNNTTTPIISTNSIPVKNEEDELAEIEIVKKQFQEFKIKNKKQKEEHEKEIKKKLENEQQSNHPHHIADHSHSGIKRSKPLAPTSAFQFYKDANPSKSPGFLLEKWRELADHEKKHFNDMAQKDKERYHTQMEEYEKIHSQVTHQKLQKKQIKKKTSDDESQNNGPKKLTKKEKLKKAQEDKEIAKQEKLNGTKKYSKKSETVVTISSSPSKKTVNIKKCNNSNDDSDSDDTEEEEEEGNDCEENEEEEDEEDEEDDDEEDEEDDEEDDDEDEDEGDESGNESNHSAFEEDVFIDEDDTDGWGEMKRGFKSSHHNSSNAKHNNRRVKWNK